jgi:hypothetical protein
MCPACMAVATEIIAGAALTAGGTTGLVSVIVTVLRFGKSLKRAALAKQILEGSS